MKNLCLVLMTAAVFWGCKKDSMNIVGHWQCNQVQQMDSVAVINKLSGTWLWEKYACFSDPKVRNADKPVKITFSANGNFTVVENAVTVTQGTWKIKKEDGTVYGLDLSQPSVYLYGRILFCNDELLFNDSYVDGCDNLFIKSN